MIIKYSIIIPTYNRSKTLALTLDSVCNQTLSSEKYEILVIDDGSTDNTKEVVSNFQKKYPNHKISYFYEQNGGPAKARNYGIKESKGEITFFTDDDCIVPNSWMETLLDGFVRHPDVAGVGGWYGAEGVAAERYFQKYINFWDSQSPSIMEEVKTNIFGQNMAGNTANMSYKKEILEKIKGFDENLYFPGAVDWELKKNIQDYGYNLLYVPFSVAHLKDFNFLIFAKKFFNQGRGRYYMSLKYPDLVKNPRYNVSFKSFLNKLMNESDFFIAGFLAAIAMFCGCLFAKYFRPFKSIKKINKLAVSNFKIVKKKFGQEKIHITEMRPFNGLKDNLNKEDKIKNNKFYSIIIPTYNRSKTLALTLDSVCNQTLSSEKYEILVIDDGSTDNTKEVVSNFQKKYSHHSIKYFYEQNGGPAKARNYGIKESKGEITFFTDDDCIVPNSWMETLLDGFVRHPDVAGVGGWLMSPKNVLANNLIERYIYYIYFLTHYFHFSAEFLFKNEIISNDPILGLKGVFANNTANLSLDRKVLEKIGGFKEDFYWPGSEDTDLVFRILTSGCKMLYLPFPVEHIKVLDLMGFTKLHFKRGANSYLFLKFNKATLEKIGEWATKDNLSFKLLIRRLLYSPYKLLTTIQFFSQKAGFIYMRRKCEKL